MFGNCAKQTLGRLDFSLGYTPVTASLLRAISKQFIPVRVRSRSAPSPVSCILVSLSEPS
jgi:hypothetical protein